MKRSQFNRYISEARFQELFVSELGWNLPKGPNRLPPVEIDGTEYRAEVVAERNNYRILRCEVDAIPPTSVCKRIDIKVRNFANDYILIFVQRGGFHHLWLAPVRKTEKRDIVTTEYTTVDQAEFLFEKVDRLSFGFGEETTIVDVRSRVQDSFAVNAEKITKDFYAGFKKEHKAFVTFISGIEGTETVERDRQWYASVMLNRLMFCYFIQKKGFLDGNVHYLRDKLEMVQRERGKNNFFRSFYLDFLKNLFHDGLNAPQHDAAFVKLYGRIPYLNGGMFDEHQIERDYAGIDIADEAFERLFAFFDKWEWHLDTRLSASGKDINPDVLGYIFEQYINDRAQMGAYYTKEDITEYIGRNCILPYLFDRVRHATEDSAKEFASGGYVWRTLRESGDRYIFDAMKKGYDDFAGIPEEISRGIISEAMRKEYSETQVAELPEGHVPLSELRSEWNKRTPEQWGLPSEIWRETIDRLQHCGDILHKIESGEITDINDFITYNLDIRTFAADLIAGGDSRFVGWFYHALQEVTILDPTCGSGAFLFAAMNILEPLYEICIDRMQEFNRENPLKFKKELAEITDKYRSNIQYFIYKSIILRNLYGVDIMVEATEIAKLRLFLKMVAVVDVDRRADNLGLDPLPDIDFNIRCGNTLVGYANKQQLERDLGHADDILQELANQEFRQQIEEEMVKVAHAYDIFKEVQLRQAEDMLAFKQAKHDLRERLAALNDKLNRRLFITTSSSPITNEEDITTTQAYKDWLKSHQPFHWLAEFYQIIEGNHGFDVIIGNPPYVEYRKNSKTYKVTGFQTESCGNIYAFIIERNGTIGNETGRTGMIIPHSSICTDRMKPLYEFFVHSKGWFSAYDTRPSHLFDGVDQRLLIYILGGNKLYSSKYNRWSAEMRSRLFSTLNYSETDIFNQYITIPKIGDKILSRIILKSTRNKVKNTLIQEEQDTLYYHNAPRYFLRFSPDIPYFRSDKLGECQSSHIKEIKLNKDIYYISSAIYNSTLFYIWFILVSNCRDLTSRDILAFPIPRFTIKKDLIQSLFIDYKEKSKRKSTYYASTGKVDYDEYYPKLSKPIIDEIDAVLARHYGFTEEELDYIINYDIKYRMGDELNNG